MWTFINLFPTICNSKKQRGNADIDRFVASHLQWQKPRGNAKINKVIGNWSSIIAKN